MTDRIITNAKKNFEDAADLDGFDELPEEYQERIKKAWEVGHVAEEDIPASARKDAEDGDDAEDGEKKKAPKKAPAKKRKTVGLSLFSPFNL